MAHLRDLAWPMAVLQERHQAGGRRLSALSVEALAAAVHLDASIGIAEDDVGPNLQAAAAAEGVEVDVVAR